MSLRLIWITALCICLIAASVRFSKPDTAYPLYLTFEPALALVLTLLPDTTPPRPTSPQPNLGRVHFGAGDVCCPGIPARNTINIASGEVMKLK